MDIVKYVSDEEIKKAREMDLLTYLRLCEPDELVQLSSGKYTTKTHDSLKIDNGKWYWWSRSIGGSTALDYLIEVKNIEFKEAVKIISGLSGGASPSFAEPADTNKALDKKASERAVNDEAEVKVLELPEKSEDSKAVFDYLADRKIDKAVINYCLENGILYQSKNRSNCVFVGYDENSAPRFACVRGTGKEPFRGDVKGSTKLYNFSIPADDDTCTKIAVFESPIDLLSHITLEKITSGATDDTIPRNVHRLSLSGVSVMALEHYLASNPKINTVILCLDNDNAGRSNTEQMKDFFENNGYNVIDNPPIIGKDYNEMLKLLCAERDRKNADKSDEYEERTYYEEQGNTEPDTDGEEAHGQSSSDAYSEQFTDEDKNGINSLLEEIHGRSLPKPPEAYGQQKLTGINANEASEAVPHGEEAAESDTHEASEAVPHGEEAAESDTHEASEAVPHGEEAAEPDTHEVSEAVPHGEEVYIQKTEMEPTNEHQLKAVPNTPRTALLEMYRKTVSEIYEGDNLKVFLDASANLIKSNHSFRNAVIISAQKPKAEYLYGYDEWKALGRQVMKGSKSVKVLTPEYASEKSNGELFDKIYTGLKKRFSENPSLQKAVCVLGKSGYRFTMNRETKIISLRIKDGAERSFSSLNHCKSYINKYIKDKVVTDFKIVSVFDIKDTYTPEYLYLKSGFESAELALENNEPVKNSRGEYKIVNSPERRELLRNIDVVIEQGDVKKAEELCYILQSITEKECSEKEEPSSYFSDNSFDKFVDKIIDGLTRLSLKELKYKQEIKEGYPAELIANACAYVTAKLFGIQTNTAFMGKIADWTDGKDFKSVEKCLEIIYSNSKGVMREIEKSAERIGFEICFTGKESEVIHRAGQADAFMEAVPKMQLYMYRACARERGELTKMFQSAKTEAEKEDIKDNAKIVLEIEKLLGEMTYYHKMYNDGVMSNDMRMRFEGAVGVSDTFAEIQRLKTSNIALKEFEEKYECYEFLEYGSAFSNENVLEDAPGGLYYSNDEYGDSAKTGAGTVSKAARYEPER